MFSSRSVQIAALFSDVFGQALPNLCRSFYNETKAEMFFSVFAVALLTEGVDRNYNAKAVEVSTPSRPPHGEHTSNPLSIRLHSPSFLQAGIDSAGNSLFPCKPAAGPRSAIPPLIFFVSALFYRHPPCRRRKMPPAGVSTLAISFSCTTVDRYPLWQ